MPRVIINFAQSAYDTVDAMRKTDGLEQIAHEIRDCIKVKRLIDRMMSEGYDVIFRDKESGEEQVMVIERKS